MKHENGVFLHQICRILKKLFENNNTYVLLLLYYTEIMYGE